MSVGGGALFFLPLPSSRNRLNNNDCLEDKRENYENCSVLCVVYGSNDMHTREQFLKVSVGFRFRLVYCVFVSV